MTDQQINNTIHAALGNPPPFWQCPYCGKVDSSKVTCDELHDVEGCLQPVRWIVVPDYVNDLNDMHEAEKMLDDGVLWKGYLNRLWDVVCPQFHQMWGLNAAVGLLLVHATARQRALAFIKTLKLTIQ